MYVKRVYDDYFNNMDRWLETKEFTKNKKKLETEEFYENKNTSLKIELNN